MILAGLRRPADQALPLAREAAAWLARYLSSGPPEPREVENVIMVASNVGNRFRIAEEYEDALRTIGVGLDVAHASPAAVLPNRLSGLLVSASRTNRDLGNIEEALAESQEAARLLEPLAAGGSLQATFTFTLALMDQAAILADPNGASLGRPAEAIALRRRVFGLLDALAHRDVHDAESRMRLVSNGNRLALLLQVSDAPAALAVYEHLLRDMAEVPDNPRFRRDEIRAWTGSAEPLRRVGRGAEARQRLDAAFARLREAGLYPADQIALGSEADDALRALADDEAARGHLVRAGEIYADLVARVTAGHLRADSSLDDAVDLSGLYAAAAQAERRAGRADLASALDDRHLALWQGWARRLPQNPVVRQHLPPAR
jgi:tetratricopeptide (TPR) repeat protein